MKMEMIVQANVSGKIKKIHVKNGEKLEGDDLILEIE
jgi:biotin carboxyl carrier protein